MKIVEYAIKIKEMGVATTLNKVGAGVKAQAAAVSGYGQKLRQMNRFYKLSYTELQQKIKETEDVIRNSVLKKEIRQARRELAALQKQSAKRSIQSGGAVSSGGLSMKGMVGAGLITAGITSGIGAIRNYGEAAREAYTIQNRAETELGVIMRQRMGATNAQIDAVKRLASEEQKRGIIGDEVQLSGAQQMGTFLRQTKSINTLLPAMNNLLAQQKGYKASAEDAVNVGNLMGKVMQGQTGALTRVGVTFSAAEEKVLKYGTESERAAMLAKVITNNMGEMNAALAATPEGKKKQHENEAGDVSEQFGKKMMELDVALLPLKKIGLEMLSGLLPVVDKIIPAISEGVAWIQSTIERVKPMLSDMVAPAIGLWNSLKDSAGGVMDYVSIIGEVWQENIYPMVMRVGGGVGKILGDMIKWVANSELVKGIFRVVAKIVGGICDLVSWIVDKLVWMWDNIVKPILNAIEGVYRWITGSGGGVKVKLTKDDKGNVKMAAATDDNSKALNSVAEAMKENSSSAASTEKAITGGGQKTITINVQKFFDNINIHAANVSESVSEIEAQVMLCLARVLNNGATSV